MLHVTLRKVCLIFTGAVVLSCNNNGESRNDRQNQVQNGMGSSDNGVLTTDAMRNLDQSGFALVSNVNLSPFDFLNTGNGVAKLSFFDAPSTFAPVIPVSIKVSLYYGTQTMNASQLMGNYVYIITRSNDKIAQVAGQVQQFSLTVNFATGSKTISLVNDYREQTGAIATARFYERPLFASEALNPSPTNTPTVLTATPTPSSSTQGYRVFLTSATYDGSQINGLTGADNLCSNAASAHGFGGTWKAVLSDSSHDAKARLQQFGLGTLPVYNLGPNGARIIVDNAANLWKGYFRRPIQYSELKTRPTASSTYWTASQYNGLKGVADPLDPNPETFCSDWTSTNGQSAIGSSNEADYRALDFYGMAFGGQSCFNHLALLCLDVTAAAITDTIDSSGETPTAIASMQLSPSSDRFGFGGLGIGGNVAMSLSLVLANGSVKDVTASPFTTFALGAPMGTQISLMRDMRFGVGYLRPLDSIPIDTPARVNTVRATYVDPISGATYSSDSSALTLDPLKLQLTSAIRAAAYSCTTSSNSAGTLITITYAKNFGTMVGFAPSPATSCSSATCAWDNLGRLNQSAAQTVQVCVPGANLPISGTDRPQIKGIHGNNAGINSSVPLQ